MALLSVFKKIFGKQRDTQPTIKEEKVAFKDITVWVVNKKKSIADEEQAVLAIMKEKISHNAVELEEKINILENVDLESIKAEERIKLIVRNNLSNYTHQAKIFLEHLNDLPMDHLEKSTSSINKIFLEFHNTTHLSYQKVTILIGKEIAVIKKNIAVLSQLLAKIVQENKHLINSSRILSTVQAQLTYIDDTNKHINKITEEIKLLNKKIRTNKIAKKKNREKEQSIKKSKEYADTLRKQEDITTREKELEKTIRLLKIKINFKELGNVFHVSKKKMIIVNYHKERFEDAIKKDSGTSLQRLLDEAKFNNNIISSHIKKINAKREELAQKKASIKKEKITDLSDRRSNFQTRITSLHNEKGVELKKFEKITKNKESKMASITKELATIGVTVTHTK